MRPFRLLSLLPGLLLLPAPAGAQHTEAEVAAAVAAVEALIEQGPLPPAATLSTLRLAHRTPDVSGFTDRVLQQMGAEVSAGQVTRYVCEAAPASRNERSGEMEERRLCRHANGRTPVLVREVTLSDSEAVVVVEVEKVFDGPVRRCVAVGGGVYDVRVVRTAGGAWRFAEVIETIEYIAQREPCWGEPEGEVAAVVAALEGLIQSGILPAAESLGTLRHPDAVPPRNRQYPDNTDRVLQEMGVEVEGGQVSRSVCEAAPSSRSERGEMEERRLCRHADGLNPVLINEVTVSGSGAVVVVGTETVHDAPTRRCVGVSGAVYEVRVARATEGAWHFVEVLRSSEYFGEQEPCWGQSPQG